MEEEITQEMGGKHCCVSLSMYICISAECPRLCVSVHNMFTSACLSVCERDLLCLLVKNMTSLIAYVLVHASLVPSEKIFIPLPETPETVPDVEAEKEEDESSCQAPTPAEDNNVKVPPFFNP